MPFSGYHFLEHRSISNDVFPTPTTAANSDDNLIKDDKKSDNLQKNTQSIKTLSNNIYVRN